MFNILVFTTNPGVASIRATFKLEAKARHAYDTFVAAKANHNRGADITTTISIEDDYSRQITIDLVHVVGIQFVRVNDELNGEADLAQLQAHAQATFNKRMQQDPMLQQGKILQAGPMNGLGMPPQGRN